jgi:hypothetical protein
MYVLRPVGNGRDVGAVGKRLGNSCFCTSDSEKQKCSSEKKKARGGTELVHGAEWKKMQV